MKNMVFLAIVFEMTSLSVRSQDTIRLFLDENFLAVEKKKRLSFCDRQLSTKEFFILEISLPMEK